MAGEASRETAAGPGVRVGSAPRTLLVIPHYRDAARVTPFLRDLVSVLPASFSILVSDDGSEAAEFARVADAIRAIRGGERRADAAELLDPIRADRNRGKGASVYAGWRQGLAGPYELLAFADADGAVCAREILRAWQHFGRESPGLDALIGSRQKILGRSVRRRVVRHAAGRVFATLVAAITGLDAYDTQCGFKILRRDVFAAIEPHVRAARFAFDVELLMLLAHFGFRCEEFAVDWSDQKGGKVNVLRDAIPMLAEVVAARRRMDGLP